MFSRYSTRSASTFTVFAIATLALAGVLMTSLPALAAKSRAAKQQTVTATVDQVDPQTGVVVLRLATGREVNDLKRGDRIAIMVEEEEAETTGQPPYRPFSGTTQREQNDPAYQGGPTGTSW